MPTYPSGANAIKQTNSSNNSSAVDVSSSNDPLQAMLDYAKATGSESAYETYLNNWYNTQMSNSAYQRAVADLEKAGLNPWLAVNNSASTPTSSSKSYSEELQAEKNRKLEATKTATTQVAKMVALILSALLFL